MNRAHEPQVRVFKRPHGTSAQTPDTAGREKGATA